ncbi:MAG: hypothetical protein ACOYXT_03960 [Bacteroidota bacterium]
MKTLRKNVDLDTRTIAVLQIEATLNGYGALKPYLENLLEEKAKRCVKEKPTIYKTLVNASQKKSK